MVILYQTSDYDNNNDLKDMVGEDWIDMSILDGEVALNIGVWTQESSSTTITMSPWDL